MSSQQSQAVGWLEVLHRDGSLAALADGELLERFLAAPGSSREVAFEVLVRRHGPLVMAVCRSILGDVHGPEDAFQATFLVLARRASTISDPDRLAPWLGRVARRIACRARREAGQRAIIERQRIACASSPTQASPSPLAAAETAHLIEVEVDRLPERDRLLVRLTYWQGKTYEEVAAQLAWPIGTVRSRLARVRQRLKPRLARLGLTPEAMTLLLRPASARTLSEAIVWQTVRVASPQGGPLLSKAAGMVPAAVLTLVESEIAMPLLTWKWLTSLVLIGGIGSAGTIALIRPVSATSPTAAAPTPAGPPVTTAAPPAPLLANGGFEDGGDDLPTAWSKGDEIPGVEYLWSRSTAHEGKASLCFKKSAARYFPIAEWSQGFERTGDLPCLKVSAWIKAKDAGKAILDAQFTDASGESTHAWVAYIGAKNARDKPVAHDWKRYEGVVAIPPGTKRITVAPQMYGPGSVWIDDIHAEYTRDAAIDPLKP